jgi:hypothetical protein
MCRECNDFPGTTPLALKTSPGGYGVILYNAGLTKQDGTVTGMQINVRYGKRVPT